MDLIKIMHIYIILSTPKCRSTSNNITVLACLKRITKVMLVPCNYIQKNLMVLSENSMVLPRTPNKVLIALVSNDDTVVIWFLK